MKVGQRASIAAAAACFGGGFLLSALGKLLEYVKWIVARHIEVKVRV